MIEEETVTKVADLARVELTPEENKQFQRELGEVIDAFKALNKVVDDKIDYILEEQKNQAREDKIKPSLEQDEALSLAGEIEEKFFVGPQTK